MTHIISTPFQVDNFRVMEGGASEEFFLVIHFIYHFINLC